MRRLLIAVVLLTSDLVSAPDKPVPVQEEPKHKTVFENDVVRVIDVQIPPGETTWYHVHVLPSVIVYLTTSTNRSENWGDKAVLTREISAGQSRYAAYDEKPLSHRVTNTGSGLFRVYDIEVLRDPPDRTPLPALGVPTLQPQWEEKRARSSRLALAVGETARIPGTARALLLVTIRGTLRVSEARNSSARALQWSDYHFAPAHSALEITNSGRDSAEAILLELPAGAPSSSSPR